MIKKIILLSKFLFIAIFLSLQFSFAEEVREIEIVGNERIPSETIKTFSSIKKNDDLDDNKINSALKSIYDSNFFQNVTIVFQALVVHLTGLRSETITV